MLIEARVLPPERAAASLVHRDEAVQGVVRHLANSGHLRVSRSKIPDEALRARMHVAGGAVDVAADNVEEIRVDPESLDRLGDTAIQVISPSVGAEVHVCQPAILMAIVVPVHPV